MSNALQYKASKGFPIFLGGGWGGGGGLRHKFWEIWRGVRANLPLLKGGWVLCISKIQLVVYYQCCVLIG